MEKNGSKHFFFFKRPIVVTTIISIYLEIVRTKQVFPFRIQKQLNQNRIFHSVFKSFKPKQGLLINI